MKLLNWVTLFNLADYNFMQEISARMDKEGRKMSPQSMSEILYPFDFIDVMKEKQELLKQVVNITRAIEKMRESLEAVVVLGQSSASLPKTILTFHRALSIKTERQPTDSIKRYLKRLEDITREGLCEILQYAHIDLDIPHWEEQHFVEMQLPERIQGMIREFQRRAMTAVSLKVLLHRRGIDTPGATIPVPLGHIRKQVATLQMKEHRQRELVKHQISEIQEDVRRMLDSEQYSEEMNAMLRNVSEGLAQDLQAIMAGGRLGNLHFSFERVVEAGEAGHMEPAATSGTSAILHNAGRQIETGKGVRRKAPTSTVLTVLNFVNSEDGSSRCAGKARMGFFRRLRLWCNTPWWISWRRLGQEV